MKEITERLVMARINRALPNGTQLHRCRKADKLFGRCGTYWLQGADSRIVKDHIDLERMGREMRAIADWETMVGYDKGQQVIPAGP
jgi:hypothetical protein